MLTIGANRVFRSNFSANELLALKADALEKSEAEAAAEKTRAAEARERHEAERHAADAAARCKIADAAAQVRRRTCLGVRFC